MLYIDSPRTVTACRRSTKPRRLGMPGATPEGLFVDWNNHVTCAHQ